MLTAPLKWLINLIALLPDVVRPGVFLAILVLIAWFVVVQRGMPSAWHAVCRGTARLLELTVGMVLLPEYLMTTSRQRRGQHPGETVLAVSGVAERLLDGADGLYERHRREPIKWKSPPWRLCLVIVVVCSIPWVAMDRLPVSSEVRVHLAKAFSHWREVEAWADVSPSRRAAPGISSPQRPVVVRVRQRGRVLGIRLRCRVQEPCVGRVIVRTASGQRLDSRMVGVKATSFATLHMRLSGTQSRQRATVRVARVKS